MNATRCCWCGRTSTGPLPANEGICARCARRTFGPFAHRLATIAGLLLVCLCARLSDAQVTAVAPLRSGIAEVRIGNPSSTTSYRVSLALFRDRTTPTTPVTLGDSVRALISPRTFTIAPGTIQTVRILVRDSVGPSELLRLATLFTPILGPQATSGARVLIQQRVITKVVAP